MQIVGHQKILNFLDRSVEKEAVSHAYLFSGSERVGKFTVAFDFAQKLTGKMNQKINSDIFVVSPDIEEKKGVIRKKDIGVEKIRELAHNLSLTSQAGKYKIAIIDEADRLTVGAQNALLKTLEEPEEKCVIILVAHNEDKILPTIKSRCIVKKFGLVKEKEISHILPDEKDKNEILFWAMGRPGLAISMSSDKEELAKKREIKKELSNMLSNNLSENFSLAENLSKDSSTLKERLEIWAAILRQNIVHVSSASSAGSLEKSLMLIEKIEEAKRLMRETNSSSRIILENLFLWLRQDQVGT